MRKLLKVNLALIFAALIFVSCDSLQSRGVSPGDRAPELSFPDLNGQPFSLEKVRGKVVLLNFWASWCAPCVVELPDLQRLHQRFESRGFTVIGVGVDDDHENLKQLRTEYGLTYPIIVDDDGNSKRSYRITGLPESLLLDRDGKVLMFIDPNNNEPSVKAAGPREWMSISMIAQIERFLATNP